MSNLKQLGTKLKELVQNRPDADELKIKVSAACVLLDELDAELSKGVEKQEDVDVSNVLIEELVVKTRRALQGALAKAGNSAAIVNATHKILIEISLTRPLNDADPITLDDIDHSKFIKAARARLIGQYLQEGFVGSSRGDVYDLRALITWDNLRPQQKNEQNDLLIPVGLKKLIDPINNEPFPKLDVEHIKAAAEQKGLRIGKLYDPDVNVAHPVKRAQPDPQNLYRFSFFAPRRHSPNEIEESFNRPSLRI